MQHIAHCALHFRCRTYQDFKFPLDFIFVIYVVLTIPECAKTFLSKSALEPAQKKCRNKSHSERVYQCHYPILSKEDIYNLRDLDNPCLDITITSQTRL